MAADETLNDPCPPRAITIFFASTTNARTRTPDVRNQEPTEGPTKLSQLDGWHGLDVGDNPKCPGCCALVIPSTFATADKLELTLLLRLARGELERDLSCPLAPTVYYALDQLVQLATVQQNLTAAQILLGPNAEAALNLDGELAEGFVIDRVIPVLLKFDRLDDLLTEANSRGLPERLCDWTIQEGEEKKADEVKRRLRAKGKQALALEIEKTCSAMAAATGEGKR